MCSDVSCLIPLSRFYRPNIRDGMTTIFPLFWFTFMVYLSTNTSKYTEPSAISIFSTYFHACTHVTPFTHIHVALMVLKYWYCIPHPSPLCPVIYAANLLILIIITAVIPLNVLAGNWDTHLVTA